MGIVRNSLAHFRPIEYDDIELIKQNAKHALIGVEECLSEMTKTYTVVPTNTTENWYKNIKALRAELCDLTIYQSSHEEWIRVQLAFESKMLTKEQWWDEYMAYTV